MEASSDLPPPVGERHVLKAEEELRLEVSFQKQSTCQILLQKGSCECHGVELALHRPITFVHGGLKLALFTWHGCVVDIQCDNVEICYTSDETACNIAYVNTHAQLEALRDEAAAATSSTTSNAAADIKKGPRILIVGATESGKSSLAKLLTSYACKLGRTPVWVDLDPADNALSIAGTVAACPMHRDACSVESFVCGGVPPGEVAPVVLWHGTTKLSPDLFKAQVTALGKKIDKRLDADDWAQSSGVIVNTNGWIQEEGYQLLLHTVNAMSITVILVMGHDRLYSMFKSSLKNTEGLKIIKLPRSGGVVSREGDFMRSSRSRSMKRYFYGDMVEGPSSATHTASTAQRVPQLTPFLVQVSFSKLTLYKFSSMSLSASLLPVAAAQTTEPVQLTPVDITETLQHAILAVCHPQAVADYEATGQAKSLYESGVAGFVAVERVIMDTEMLHLLSPCAGSLPSHTLILGEITWME